MSRHRSISTDISTDTQVAELAERGPMALLLYTWAIPHADDWGRMTGDPRQFKLLVCPGLDVTARDVDEALSAIGDTGLWLRYEVGGKRYIAFPPQSWFKHQNYIPKSKRYHDGSLIPEPNNPAFQLPEAPENDVLPQIPANPRKSPQNTTSPSPSPSPSMENVPTERGASAPPMQNTTSVDKPGTNGHKPPLPERRDSDTTDRAYWERILKEAPANQRTALLVRLAHEKIGADDTPGGSSYARLGKMAKDYRGAGLVATWILQAATEHIAGDPLDYLTVLAKKQTNRANQNGRAHPTTAANREPVYATADQAAPKGWE